MTALLITPLVCGKLKYLTSTLQTLKQQDYLYVLFMSLCVRL